MNICDINLDKIVSIENDDVILLRLDTNNYSVDTCMKVIKNWSEVFPQNTILLDIGIKDYEIIKKGEENEFLTRINR